MDLSKNLCQGDQAQSTAAKRGKHSGWRSCVRAVSPPVTVAPQTFSWWQKPWHWSKFNYSVLGLVQLCS